jgi:predicted nucleotidyltransferase
VNRVPENWNGAMRARIAAMLDRIEREQRVRILLAVESGSRAWGFPSRDSDWDVRFLYLRPLAAYLAIEPLRDVIEVPLTDELDLNGWDLRKALRLLVRSNAVVLEWLGSPVIYRRDEAACAALAELARESAHLPTIAYHYDRLARRHWRPAQPEPIRLKTLFYALRPALALAWMRAHGPPPPMHLPALLAGLHLPSDLTEAITALQAQKFDATESDTAPQRAAIEAFLAEVLATSANRAAAWDRSHTIARADELFLRLATASISGEP